MRNGPSRTGAAWRRGGALRLLAVVLMLAAGMSGAGMPGAGMPGTVAPARAAAFVDVLGDVPLAPGLSVVPGSGVMFDTPQGRIVEVYATGAARATQVRTFYRETLPQLGWQPTGHNGFQREGERLTLNYSRVGRDLTVHYALAPAGG